MARFLIPEPAHALSPASKLALGGAAGVHGEAWRRTQTRMKPGKCGQPVDKYLNAGNRDATASCSRQLRTTGVSVDVHGAHRYRRVNRGQPEIPLRHRFPPTSRSWGTRTSPSCSPPSSSNPRLNRFLRPTNPSRRVGSSPGLQSPQVRGQRRGSRGRQLQRRCAAGGALGHGHARGIRAAAAGSSGPGAGRRGTSCRGRA